MRIGYDVAQICLNGHVINEQAKYCPQHNRDFCDRCWTITIKACPECKSLILGCYLMPGEAARHVISAPSFCHHCGASYPWTEAALKAAQELIDLSNITDKEKNSLKMDVPALMSDTPRTKVAIAKAKAFMSKAGPELASAFRDIVVDIASETAKKALFPDS